MVEDSTYQEFRDDGKAGRQQIPKDKRKKGR